MHPFFLNRFHLFAYVLGWLGFSVLVSLAVAPDSAGFWSTVALLIPVAVTHSFVSLSSWYLCRSLPLRETPSLRLAVALLSTGVVGGFILLALTLGWAAILDAAFKISADFTGRTLRLIFGAGVTFQLLGVVFHYLLVAFESSRTAERRSLEAEVFARAAELKALRAQIDPHFLYNSLNSISALIAANPPRAREMTIQLAEFFRASVAAGRQSLISLKEEFALIRNYLDIEKVRHGDRLHIELSLDQAAAHKAVPPLILQPLIENAIKHGIAHLVEGGTVNVHATLVGANVRIVVTNPVDAELTDGTRKSTSFGLRAVRDRIEAVSRGKGDLSVRNEGDSFEASVTLPGDLT